ncbi:hypothetical protein [Marinicella rhabdoformis]|uniref:hypothetical protein n=1 Tax=Marinicella rhabdoformis TaxID=2580566 RepID=UPI0012AECA4F|nr:hypothetical protein [Marinicella rhabdoformis]
MKTIVMTLLLLFSFSVHAQVSDEAFETEINKTNVIHQLEQVAAGTFKKQQFERFNLVMNRLVELRPQNTRYLFSLAKSYALLDKKTEAYNALVKLQNAGFSYPIAENTDFNKVAGTKVYDYIEDGMIANGKPYGTGQSVAKVSEQYGGMLFENIAFDKNRSRFLLGSIRSGEVYFITESGVFKPFIKPQTGENETYGVVDLVTDPKRDFLWLATASMPQYNGTTQANFGMATISKFRLSTGEWLENIDTSSLSKPLLFNALHVTDNGDLYFINPFTREVMTVNEGESQIKPFLNVAQLSSVKAITSNNDASILYVSDYDKGLFLINRDTKAYKMLNDPKQTFLSGIDDLFYSDGDLIAIQNQTSPNRILRVLLKEDLFFQGAVPVESNNELASAMTKGFVDGGDVYYIANSQWGKMDMGGNLQEGKSWDPVHIIKAENNYKIQEFIESQQRIADIKKKRGIK